MSDLDGKTDVEVHHEKAAHHEIEGESLMILFVITTLIVSIISKEINKRWSVPYTPLLILFGILIGGVPVWGLITKSVDLIITIEPHAILMIMLPILIFESSFNAHIPILSTNYIQVLTLIGPAVVITALLLAVALKNVIGYPDEEMDWWAALTLGSILAATDPVAVVALLKELGAPLHINTLIEMESLFNDGTAMVFFSIFYELAKGGEKTIGEAVVMFLRLALGGPALGVLFGIGVMLVLQFTTIGQTLFLHLILVSCYSVFFVGEELCGVSGLLAIVGCGLFLNAFMKNKMTLGQEENIESIISYIQYVNESVLFFFAGVIIGEKIKNHFADNITGADWGYMVLLYLIMIVIRGITLLFLYPCLYYTGEGFSYKEFILSVWGGLRGALSVALSLVVATDKEFPNKQAQILILFHTCGCATLTLLINGSTAAFLVKGIELIQNLESRKHFKSLFLKAIKKEGQTKLESLKYDVSYSTTLWTGVEDIVQFNMIDEERQHISEIRKRGIIARYQQMVKERLGQHRFKILRHLMKFIHESKEEEYLHNSIYEVIEESVEQACEATYYPIVVFDRVRRGLPTIEFMLTLQKLALSIPLFGIVFELWLMRQLENTFLMLQILQQCLTSSANLERMYVDNDQPLDVIAELQNELKQVDDHMNKLRNKFSDQLVKISQQQAALKVIKAQAKFVDERIGGQVAEKEGTEIRNIIMDKMITISSLFAFLKLKGGKQLFLETTFRGFLDVKQLQIINQQKIITSYPPNTEIITKEAPINELFIILSGVVEEKVYKRHDDYEILEFTSGGLVGLANLVDEQINSLVSIRTVQSTEMIRVPITTMREFFKTNPHFEEFCYRRSLPVFLRMYCHDPDVASMSTVELIEFSKSAQIVKASGVEFNRDDELIQAENGAFIFDGCFQRSDKSQIFKSWSFIEASPVLLHPLTRSVIAIFKMKAIKTAEKMGGSRRKSSINMGDVKSDAKKQIHDMSLLLDHQKQQDGQSVLLGQHKLSESMNEHIPNLKVADNDNPKTKQDMLKQEKSNHNNNGNIQFIHLASQQSQLSP